jgi:hypothetical protein
MLKRKVSIFNVMPYSEAADSSTILEGLPVYKTAFRYIVGESKPAIQLSDNQEI